MKLTCVFLLLALLVPFRVEATARVRVSGAEIEIVFPAGTSLDRDLIVAHVERSARAVASYYGKFPVKWVRVEVKPTYGRGIKYGNASGWDGPNIKIYVGVYSNASDFDKDWVVVHEMIHLGFPSLDGRYAWIEEGLATYAEPIARARVGIQSRDEVWKEWVREMPAGLTRESGRGLNYAHGWSRIYWGGALFYLLADIEYHKRTDLRGNLEKAIRGINAQGGNITVEWSVEKALKAGDKAAGAEVLKALFNEMSEEPYEVDLPALWRSLGVEVRGDRVIYDDRAPLARIRDMIVPPQPYAARE